MTSQADLQYWKDAIINNIHDIHNLIKSAENTTRDELTKLHMLNMADEKLRSTQSIAASLKKEIRLIFDHTERSQYNEDLKRYEHSISNISIKIKALRSVGDRKQLFLGAKNSNNVHGDDYYEDVEDGVIAGDAILKGAEHLQNETGQSLSRTEQMIEDAKMVASSTVGALQQQTEQIDAIDKNVSKVNEDLNRSDKLIKTFARRMATDKFIQCLACGNVMMIVGIVALVLIRRWIKSGETTENESGFDRDSPVDGRMLRGFLPIP